MKTLEFIFQETQIHFALQNNGAVMVNATEMAKAFDKQVRSFIRLDGTEIFIEKLIERENNRTDLYDYNGNKKAFTRDDIIHSNKKAGTLMHRKLALKFAAWLDVDFELWVIDTIDDLLFGNYKKHWEAHATQEKAKIEIARLKKEMLLTASLETNLAYFNELQLLDDAKKAKTRAIRNQIKLF